MESCRGGDRAGHKGRHIAGEVMKQSQIKME